MITQADKDLVKSILGATGISAEHIDAGLAFTQEVEECARHRLAERAAIVTLLRDSPRGMLEYEEFYANAIEAGEHEQLQKQSASANVDPNHPKGANS